MPPAAMPRISLDARLRTRPSPTDSMMKRLSTSLYILHLALDRAGLAGRRKCGHPVSGGRATAELLHDLLTQPDDVADSIHDQRLSAGVSLDRFDHGGRGP